MAKMKCVTMIVAVGLLISQPQQVLAEVCDPNELRPTVASFNQEMAISQARGDLKRMGELFRNLYGHPGDIVAGGATPGVLYHCDNIPRVAWRVPVCQ